MRKETRLYGETRLSWGKAAIAALFALVFFMLFTGFFNLQGNAGELAVSESHPLLQAMMGSLLLPERGTEADVSGSTSSGEKDLIPGDILLGRCGMSPVPSLNPMNGWTHAALYIGDGQLIVAGNPASGVIRSTFSSWSYPEMTWVAYLRVITADEEVRGKAVQFAVEKRGQPYDLNWLSKQADGESWYCSELIWASYLYASEGRIDLADDPDIFGISPDEIYTDEHTAVIGGHYERKPDIIMSVLMKVFALCTLFGVGRVVLDPFFVAVRRKRQPGAPPIGK